MSSESAKGKSENHEASTDDPEIMDMVSMLMQWHENRINQLQQILTADQDTAFQVQSENGDTITLEGDILKGFKAGISVAEELFTPFPIEVSRDEENKHPESSNQ